MSFPVEIDQNKAIIKTDVERLNISNASDLKEELLRIHEKEKVNHIIIDMTPTRYCDSSGLSAILLANRICKNTNGKFILCGLQSNVLKMIEIAQLDKVLKIVGTRKEAISLLND